LRVQFPQVRFMVFNHQNPVFRDVRVRRAVALAVPWCRLLGQTEECSGSIIPRGIAGFAALPRTWDLARAREELAAAGHASGAGLPELVIRYRAFTHDLRGVAMVQDALADLGIRSRLEYREGRGMDGVDLGLLGWSLDYSDASNAFELFHSRGVPPNGWNDGWFVSEEYDRMLDAATAIAEATARAGAYERLTRWFDDHVVAVPYRQVDEFHALGKRVGSVSHDSMGYLDWATASFREAKP
jgi:ABC-type transport system substrate-binding protein